MPAETQKYRIWKMMQKQEMTTEAVRAELKCASGTATAMCFDLVAEGCAELVRSEQTHGGMRKVYRAIKTSIGPMRYAGGSKCAANKGHPDYQPVRQWTKRTNAAGFAEIPYGVLADRSLDAFLGIRV